MMKQLAQCGARLVGNHLVVLSGRCQPLFSQHHPLPAPKMHDLLSHQCVPRPCFLQAPT